MNPSDSPGATLSDRSKHAKAKAEKKKEAVESKEAQKRVPKVLPQSSDYEEKLGEKKQALMESRAAKQAEEKKAKQEEKKEALKND
jgi:hypothetical protein